MDAMKEQLVGPGGYMPRVTSVVVIGDFKLRLRFNDGLVRELDLADRLRGPVFEPLKDPAYFARVQIEGESIEWPNGASFSPEFLHGDFEPEPRD